jgi:spore coat polysaccharide biosynthesis predicted glycosyltransferase SpsG
VARKVLVTLGGGDPDSQTLKAVRALQQVDVDRLEAVVVVGASNPHYQELEFAVRNSQFGIRLVRNVSNMPELMAWADVAVTAGGSTCWEIAFFGLPSVLLMLADNQQVIAEGLNEAGVALNLGWYEEVTGKQIAGALSNLVNNCKRRRQMSRDGQDLVDGIGGERVVATLNGRELAV